MKQTQDYLAPLHERPYLLERSSRFILLRGAAGAAAEMLGFLLRVAERWNLFRHRINYKQEVALFPSAKAPSQKPICLFNSWNGKSKNLPDPLEKAGSKERGRML